MRNKSVVTDYLEGCYLCGRQAHGVHHLLFGSAREKADEDGIYLPICDTCHIYGKYRIHDNPVSEDLSKMLGQALWIVSQLPQEQQRELKDKFIKRYGRNYI